MIHKLGLLVDWISNMGFKYIFFRVFHELKIKFGFLKSKFPIKPKNISLISLEEWRGTPPPFFFYGKDINGLKKERDEKLFKVFQEIKQGSFTFFSKEKYDLGNQYDWITNPTTNHKYDIEKHWSEVQDLTKEAGDIKFVWEKSRFSYIYDIIRYDFHFEDDCSRLVLSEIESFIDANPINMGPNYKCSQEISLRTLNWTFALYYYKDSKYLEEHLFNKIMNTIYWQLHHVYKNIHFSRIAVRNNHALTESLMLFLSGLLFPFLPDVKKWSKKGKEWFEKEIAYQIYEDGTFLQYSMNYHRVAIQLLTWGIRLANLNNIKFHPVVKERAEKSLEFLDACYDDISGNLPNYGSNDGALFFKFTSDDYRNYSSQLNDLRMTLLNYTFNSSESLNWIGFSNYEVKNREKNNELSIFPIGGYYIMQEEDVKTFIKCGSYKDRPGQSDNLHIDIWVKGKNIIRDSGTYKYNTSDDLINYFNGCGGHNTISVNGANQMYKGSRFIWHYWVKNAKASITKTNDNFIFDGQIHAFKNEGKNIIHQRKIAKTKGELVWEINDTVKNKKSKEIQIFWHLNPDFTNQIEIICFDENGVKLSPRIEKMWFSGYYGFKQESTRISFFTKTKEFNTILKIKDVK